MDRPREVLILKSGRCSWGKCIFCGYGSIFGDIVCVESLNVKFDEFFKKIKPGVKEVCVYGSGSFFDEEQVPNDSRGHFISLCKKKGIEKITVESRPEFLSGKLLSEFKGFDYTISIGLEVADDKILRKLNKGFKLKDFEEGAKKIHNAGGKVRAYLPVNPPFVGDVEKSIDKSVKYALKHADSVVLINTLPHANAPLFDFWVRGEWNFLSKEDFAKVTLKWADHPKIDLDFETFRFTPKFPKRLRKKLAGVGEEYLTHPYFEVWQDWLCRWYKPPEKRRTILFLSCAFKKPYSESETHKKIIEVLNESGKRGSIHEVMLSNAGVIPREFEDHYPFNDYDWSEKNETPEIRLRYVEVTGKRIGEYLSAHKTCYDKFLCYLKPDSDSYKALEMAVSEVDGSIKNLLTGETYMKVRGGSKPLTQNESLKDLEKGLENEVR